MGYCICERCGRFDEFRVRAFYRIMHYFYFRVNFIGVIILKMFGLFDHFLSSFFYRYYHFPLKIVRAFLTEIHVKFFFQKVAGVSHSNFSILAFSSKTPPTTITTPSPILLDHHPPPFQRVFLRIDTLKNRYFQLRPYTLEHTGTRLISEVKLVMAQSVLWWGTTREYWVL